MEVITEEFLRKVDDRLIDEDVDLHQRPFHVMADWMDEQGVAGDFLDEGRWKPLMAAYKKLYPTGDFSMPGLLSAGVAIRDRMYPVHVEIGFGTVSINPLEMITITREELSSIFNTHPQEGWKALYGVCDLWDFAYSIDDLRFNDSPAADLLNNARSAITATARTLLGSTNIDSAVQSCCLAAELSIKGVLTILGASEKAIKSLSHNLVKAADLLISVSSNGNDQMLREACDNFPDYVSTRYSSHGLRRVELMALAMRSQFVAAEALRRISERDFAGDIYTATKQARPKV
ncbi:HEPN domain-containing protein [Pseudomonas syringae pv. aptata]|uniref:HEPN domain-containing protein n=1 Tax=Pseudomonas syringae TaxID=317 RepID=UPI00203CEBC9|nr:HEPN domain-containing protein [Pseudomonas syringae]MCK0544520.1 HEPN domain-containing protein [Pseudomonas syringae pv. aptata]